MKKYLEPSMKVVKLEINKLIMQSVTFSTEAVNAANAQGRESSDDFYDEAE